jgi:hypothetical protein
MLTDLSPKIPSFCCEKCHIKTNNKKDFNKHLLTLKHKNRHSLTKNDNSLTDLSQNIPTFDCLKCGKNYKSRTGLWYHEKKCFKEEKEESDHDDKIEESTNNNEISQDLILNVLQQNKELQKLLIEQNKQNYELQNKVLEICKNTSVTNSHNTTTNSHNKTFNLQFFLNETCKNAMNITDFVDSIKLQLSDLESVGKIGYIEGLSKIISRNLNALDVTERPVHCSDSKRETMYIKDEDKWEKESENNEKVLKAIEDIANKNSKMIKEWKKHNPECSNSKSHKADVYSHIMIEAVCSNNDVNNKKIMKKLIKDVTIDKSKF